MLRAPDDDHPNRHPGGVGTAKHCEVHLQEAALRAWMGPICATSYVTSSTYSFYLAAHLQQDVGAVRGAAAKCRGSSRMERTWHAALSRQAGGTAIQTLKRRLNTIFTM
jgi:hypothetical protein